MEIKISLVNRIRYHRIRWRASKAWFWVRCHPGRAARRVALVVLCVGFIGWLLGWWPSARTTLVDAAATG